MTSRVRDRVESVVLVPHTGAHDREALRRFRAALLAGTASPDDCPACDGRGGPLLDDWGYERTRCPGCDATEDP